MKALLVIDYQYDFADPNGALSIKGADTLRDGIVTKIKEYKANGDLVIFTKDWHTPNHSSFEEWPVHCVQNTLGAELMIDEALADFIILKGDDQESDSYSAFYRGYKIETELDMILHEKNIVDLAICGLALDVCVAATYRDAVEKGYKAVLLDLSKPINEHYVFKA